MALAIPLMDTSRARTELGWQPRFTATEAIAELLAGMRAGRDTDTPPLSRHTSGPLRIRELLGRVGGRP
jgi:hypothetical protein